MKNLAAKTSWGDIALTVSSDALLACTLPAALDNPFEYIGLTDRHPLAQAIDRFLSDFFKGKTAAFTGKLQPAGSKFQQQVWQELQAIPCGQTRTYGQMAEQIGNPKAVRAIGGACGANPLPLFIPCHRVIAKTGLGGFSGGLTWKKLLLSLEGHSY